MKKILLLLLISFAIIYNSCKKETPIEPELDPPKPDVIIPKTTKVIDSTDYSSDLINISNDSSSFIFKSDFNSKYNPNVNDILVITNGSGLLRKITNVQTAGNEVTVTTTQGTLIEAIEKGKISFRQSLQKSQINKVDYYYDGITYKLNKGQESNYEFDIDIVLYDLDGNLNTTNDQVKLVGNFILTADLIFEANIEFPHILQSAKIGLETYNSENLSLIADLNYSLEEEVPLASIQYAPIYYPLGLPPFIPPAGLIIVILPRLDIKVGLNGYANANLTIGVENSINYEAGIQYIEGQGWSSYSEFTNQLGYNLPILTTNAGARAFIKPEVSIAAYGVLAGYANAEVYGEIIADISSVPWWQLYAGLDFNVGARATIWGYEFFDYETNVLELRWLLAQASGGNTPLTPTLLSPSNGATNISIPATLSWNTSTGATSYALQVSTNSNFTNLVYNQSGLTGTSKQVGGLSNSTEYYWRVNATNNNGTSDWSIVRNFTTVAGGTPPQPPILSSPSNGATNIYIPTTLSWNVSSSATSYTLQVSTNSNFTNLVYNQSGLITTSKQINNLNNSTKYYWRVNASNSYGTSSWSNIWSFTTIAQLVWAENFEVYSTGSFPYSWTGDGNGTDTSVNFITNSVFYSGSKSFNLFGVINGCWASIAYRPLTISPTFEIELAIRNGNENLSGCNPDRAGIGIRQGFSWTNPGRKFILFNRNGNIVSSGGNILQSYNSLEWYQIKIRYERPSTSEVKISYWINGIFKGEETLGAYSQEDEMTNFEVTVLEGTAWFDNIKVFDN